MTRTFREIEEGMSPAANNLEFKKAYLRKTTGSAADAVEHGLGYTRKLMCASFALVLWATILLATPAQGAAAKDQVTLDAMALNAATNSVFSCVGRVVVYNDVRNNLGAAGTGQLIGLSGDWVLTAGHVITGALSQGRIELMVFRIGPDANNPVLEMAVDRWIVFPGFADGNSGHGVDVALIHLSLPITNVAAAILFDGSQASLVAQSACTVGYGTPAISGLGLLTNDRMRRAGQNQACDCPPPSVDPDYIWCNFSSPGDASAQPLEWQGTPGDSGGGWFCNINGQYQLAAISSGITVDPYYNYGQKTYAYFVGAQLDWIYGVIGVTPSLSVQQTDAVTIQIQWPSWATSFELQTSTNLDGTNWTTVATPPTADGTNKFVLAAPSAPAQFWRLAKQPSAPARATAPRPPAPVGLYDDLIGHEP